MQQRLDPDLLACSQCLCLASRRAARALTRAFDRHMRPHGMRTTQFSVLTNLLLRGPLTIGQLAECLGLERTTLTRNLALIEREGWVEIHPGADARSRVVTATPAARSAVAAALPAWHAAQAAAAEAIGPGAVAALHALADDVAA